ncbi:hypothetical protein L1049_012734 [Liquidambar formosana]|uniref:non-specific serine/threonine protein kinase n=1 Tax=Liquidambar formosana TaxID=63359 RepID=A0AAP0RJ79_LIQFO
MRNDLHMRNDYCPYFMPNGSMETILMDNVHRQPYISVAPFFDLKSSIHSAGARDFASLANLNCGVGIESTERSAIWELTEIKEPSECHTLVLPDKSLAGRVAGLIYSHSGDLILGLTHNATHKLWRWPSDQHWTGKENATVLPQIFQPSSGIVTTNEINAHPKNALPCFALTKTDSYLFSLSGGEISQFILKTLEAMGTIMLPPSPIATYLAILPRNNDILAIGFEDCSIKIYYLRTNKVKARLEGHQKRITFLAFSEKLNVLVSSGADGQICVWSTNGWERQANIFVQTAIQQFPDPPIVNHFEFHKDQTQLLAVHERQIDIYAAPKLEHLKKLVLQESNHPITHATYSCDGQSIYASFKDGSVGVYVSSTLGLRCLINLAAYTQPDPRFILLLLRLIHLNPTNLPWDSLSGRVHVLEPLESVGEWGIPPPPEDGNGHSMPLNVAAQQATDPAEVAALNKMIDYWNLKGSLNLTIDPCTQNATWASENANPRVACDCTGNTCHITHLKIYALDISGELPGDLFMLKELMDLNLGQNVLSGPIPAEIGQLSKMQYLSLGINNLTGPVPPELGNLTKLLSLSFSSNNFFGPLPKDLGNLTSLQQLYIDSSGVSGLIPQELANLKSLQTLWASDNLFTGKVPEFFGTLTELKNLRLEGTLLQGPIPNSFGALTKLEDLRIGDLGGEDSSLDFLENQTLLSILVLRNCRLSGQIPERLGIFSKLQQLDLSFNKLTGQIPTSFQNFDSLEYLYLGSNNLSGALPANIIGPKLIALDVSFNPLSGNLPIDFAKAGLTVNDVGTSINANSLQDKKAFGMLHCLQGSTRCSNKVPDTSFSIKCGGTTQTSASGIIFDDDTEILGAASLYTSSDYQWAVSNAGNFISNPNGPQYIVQTDSQITETLESELYKTARISPSSLRYYGLGLKNGKYSVELHFAEIAMDDSHSWKGLGRRLFDVYIQGERVLQDFNIRNEAGGSKRALVKTFEANVTNTIMDVHFFWAGKGTCCIPFQGTYGPLVSAIHVSQVSADTGSSSKSDKKRVGRLVGIAVGCVAGLVIISSMFYLWWKKEASGHMQIHTESPKKGLFQ